MILMREAVVTSALAALIFVGIAGTMMALGVNKNQRVLETTVQMERLATKLEHGNKIATETRLELARVTHQHWYDCDQETCSTALRTRNFAVRARLQPYLQATDSPPN